ncbi:hypothetical protein Bhyg_14793, partial [Pseudolycoriella hygida]
VRVFHQSDGITHSPLWNKTWSRIGEFLPQLKDELFSNEVQQVSVQNTMNVNDLAPSAVPSNPTESHEYHPLLNVIPANSIPQPSEISTPDGLHDLGTPNQISSEDIRPTSLLIQDQSTIQSTVPLIIPHNPMEAPSPAGSTGTVPVAAIAMSLQQQNQFPSHTNLPINIVRSYNPIFVQPQNQPNQNDIYNDYVSNPYNLTLKSSDEN